MSSSSSTADLTFRLNEEFVAKYANLDHSKLFGFNGLGEIVYKRTYSRLKRDGTNEEWHETIERVINGTFSLLLRERPHCLEWNDLNLHAETMFDLMYNMKILPPGRGLWAMGTSITEDRHIYAALNNCGFISTRNLGLNERVSYPFTFLMDASMLGVGIGFDTRGSNPEFSKMIPDVTEPEEKKAWCYEIPDSREGWVAALGHTIDSYFNNQGMVEFDFTNIREQGLPIKCFGGVTSGPLPLIQLIKDVKEVLNKNIGEPISMRTIVDIQNHIGKCVISGNVRRTAEIAFSEIYDEEFLHLKNYKINPERAEFGWTSNNSVFASIGDDYTKIANSIKVNGEPGVAWLSNMKSYSRLCDPKDFKDSRVAGGNPCLEQSLESGELCCLVEVFLPNQANLSEFLLSLSYAHMYAKIVSLGETHWSQTNLIMKRNRRIGCSLTGVAQFLQHYFMGSLVKWCCNGYQHLVKRDILMSRLMQVERSIKLTSIKPSGTVSLLAGVTPGVHFPESRYYIRRMRLSAISSLIPSLREANYHMEECLYDPSSIVVSFPVCAGENIRTLDNVSMWEQLALAALMQRYWADNQVSCTITFNPITEGGQIEAALVAYEHQLKGISFLPRLDKGAYAQMPYESISKSDYYAMCSYINNLDTRDVKSTESEEPKEAYCDNTSCSID